MKTRVLIIAFTLFISLSLFGQDALSVGDDVPRFTAVADDGSTWDISEHIGDKYIVVYFYPAAMTGGCTAQACEYRDHQDDLAAADAMVVGVSGDRVESLRVFKLAENLNFPLLSDTTGEIAEKFGVPVGDGGSMQRTVEGTQYDIIRDVTIRRWTFVVGLDGKIVYKNESVNPGQDTQDILSFLQAQN